ncbi:MAG TPA: hypothetical protein VJ894_07245, partial [Cryomorphaceae bacterium]|nr:hypothetical protein [Cryomorphaceae bacterium]
GFLLLGPEVRYFLNRSFYVSGNAGYGISIDNEVRDGGFYYHPSLGLLLNRSKSVGFTFSIGYMNQSFSEERTVLVTEDGTEILITKNDDFSLGFLQFTAGVLF